MLNNAVIVSYLGLVESGLSPRLMGKTILVDTGSSIVFPSQEDFISIPNHIKIKNKGVDRINNLFTNSKEGCGSGAVYQKLAVMN